MRKFVVLFCFLSLNAMAQRIVLRDGTVILPSAITVFPESKSIEYKENTQVKKLAFSKLDSAQIGGKRLKNISKNNKAYYLLATHKGKEIGVISRKIKKSRGGYETILDSYELVVSDKGKIIESLNFTASKAESEILKREQFFTLAHKHFSECLAFIDKIELFRSGQDTENRILLHYLDNPEFTSCP